MENVFNGSEKIGEIVSGFPGSSNLLKEYNIDFCCGGNRDLSTVLRQQNINEKKFLEKLNQIYANSNKNKDQSVDWRKESMTDLIDYVVHTHHVYLQKELPLLSEFVTKIVRVHGPNHGDVLLKLHQLFHQVKTELEEHLILEEEFVFPIIKQYEKAPSPVLLDKTAKAIEELEAEHSNVGDLLKEMRAVTSDYELPPEACTTYALTFQKLKELENDIFQHIHLENNILFPRLTSKL